MLEKKAPSSSSDIAGRLGRHEIVVMRGIVFFDSECLMCSHSVRLVMRWDRKRCLHYASLCGETASRMGLQLHADEEENTMVFVADGRRYVRSDAVLAMARVLGFPWALVMIAKVIPRTWRDSAYRWIARNRYRWFGKTGHCQLLREDERQRLLP